jgi:beta-lactamase regulating signal transducer with metallopeptidase domain
VETLLLAGLSNAVSATLLALLVACLARFLVRRPAVLHCLWMLVLLKLVTPPLFEVPVWWPRSWRAADATPVLASAPSDNLALAPAARVPELAFGQITTPITARGPERAQGTDRGILEVRPAALSLLRRLELDWLRLAATIWLAGSAAAGVAAMRRIMRFQRLLRDASPADGAIQDWVDELAANLGLERGPTVWWTSAKLSPMIWALGRHPRLILPVELWKSLHERKRATLVVHELAHLRRGDHRVRFFELLVTVLYWWHPVLWWARRALRDVEEQCCDAWVVWTFPDAAKSYAETLLETLDFLNQSDQAEPLLASGFGKVHHLRKRLTMIMSGNVPRLVSAWGALGSLAIAAVLLPVNATWAQKPAENDKEDVVVETVVVDPTGSARTITGPQADATVAIVGTIDTADQQPKINVTVKTDDKPAVIVSGSLEQAITALKQQLGAIKQKAPLSNEDKRRSEALARAIEEINKVAKQIEKLHLGEATAKTPTASKRVVIRKLDTNRIVELSPGGAGQKAEAEKRAAEARAKALFLIRTDDAEKDQGVQEKRAQIKQAEAELQAARAKVEALTAELHKKRQELAQANRELSRATRSLPEARVLLDRLNDTGRLEPGEPLGIVKGMQMGDADRKRLTALEKKLDKLLEEVASLKKQRGH